VHMCVGAKPMQCMLMQAVPGMTGLSSFVKFCSKFMFHTPLSYDAAACMLRRLALPFA
jgi:hypothetical protein